MLSGARSRHQIVTFHQNVYTRQIFFLKIYVEIATSLCDVQRRCPHKDSHTWRSRRIAKNTANAHHGHRLLDRCLAQTTFSSGYQDKTATDEDVHIRSDLANLLPVERLCRGAAMHR